MAPITMRAGYSEVPISDSAVTGARLGSLTLPDDDPAGSEAVTLFADRARSADMHFALDDQTGPAVVRLVRRLDGMPLAIELAVCEMPASAAASCCPGSPACIFLKSPVSRQYLMSGSCAKAGQPEWLAV